jgi:hypothetical protein
MASRTRRGGSGPWKSRAGAPLDIRTLEDSIRGPAAGRVDGFDVRRTSNDTKRYRCPYCEGWVEPGTPHTVAVPTGRTEDRRHYHSSCWVKQAASRRGGRQ